MSDLVLASEFLHTIADAIAGSLQQRVAPGGRVDRARLDAEQNEAFELARAMGDAGAASACAAFLRTPAATAHDAALGAIYVAGAVRAAFDRVTWIGLGLDELCATPQALAVRAWASRVLAPAALTAVGSEVLTRGAGATGSYGLGEEHEEIRATFGRFSDERVAPLAESIHRHDGIIPESLLKELAGLGVFGISIPDQYGGSLVDNLTMCLATEELSRGSLGAGGSVITRPEICAKALLKGGSEEQKRRWLPQIAAGSKLVSVAVTEPNAGSDVASLRVTARPTEGGWLIDGEKTWCTFAGRADVFILLARTGSVADGARGLTLFLVEKPALIDEHHHHRFAFTQPGGGTIEGHAIPTIGYRGMHSFTVTFDSWFVPDENRVGAVGEGFGLQMAGFAGGRIQTAARAVGVMESALRQAVSYAQARQVFGQALGEFAISRARLARMAATIFASRQFSYAVARELDLGRGEMEASLVKLVACRDAEWVTRDAMQLHGGMGYSEEYAVSRLWQDARVLSIFEGAEEVLAVYVVARARLASGASR